MGATSASISSGLNVCAQVSAGPSGDQGNASSPTSIHIKDFLKTVSMFPPVDCVDESCADFAFLPHNSISLKEGGFQCNLANVRESAIRVFPDLSDPKYLRRNEAVRKTSGS